MNSLFSSRYSIMLSSRLMLTHRFAYAWSILPHKRDLFLHLQHYHPDKVCPTLHHTLNNSSQCNSNHSCPSHHSHSHRHHLHISRIPSHSHHTHRSLSSPHHTPFHSTLHFLKLKLKQLKYQCQCQYQQQPLFHKCHPLNAHLTLRETHLQHQTSVYTCH